MENFYEGSRGNERRRGILQGIPCVRYGDIYTFSQAIHLPDKELHNSWKERPTNTTPIQRGDILFTNLGGDYKRMIGKSSVNMMDTRLFTVVET